MPKKSEKYQRPASTTGKVVEAITHYDDKRKNLPSAELQPVMQKKELQPVKVTYPRNGGGLEEEKAARNRDIDPQLVWRGKDQQDWSELVVNAPPLYIQEKVHPKALIDDLRRHSKPQLIQTNANQSELPDLFSDFNGTPEGVDKYDFYQHDSKWQNRMILGDSLQVMASLAEREGLRGQVQCIYLDPPYGIKFNSNFQWSTTSRNVKDGKVEHITREPEQVKAYRDTWRDGIHSYLTYLRDRLVLARDLLHETGSIFVQIGDENVHRVRALMDDVFGEANFVSQITVRKTTSEGNSLLGATCDFLLWYARRIEATKVRPLYLNRSVEAENRYTSQYLDGSYYRLDNITSSRGAGEGDVTAFHWFNKVFDPGKGTFKTTREGLVRLGKAGRLIMTKTGKLNYRRSQVDFGLSVLGNLWADLSGAVQSRSDPKIYVVQTSTSIVARCLLLTTGPGDLVLDPTCGSGTTAHVAEQWGRRWITIDTSRVALALARGRLMGARYPYYYLADSPDGQRKEARASSNEVSSKETFGNIRHGFVYERVPHVRLGDIARNAEVDVIWEHWQSALEDIKRDLNQELRKEWEEWEIPLKADQKWTVRARKLHSDWWAARLARQREIDDSNSIKAEPEHLYDKPYPDAKKVRVAGPFTVESLSPHRPLVVDENDELIDAAGKAAKEEERDFVQMILDNLKTAGVQQARREDKIEFTSLKPWPGYYICAEGTYMESDATRRAGIFIGPEFGTVPRPDLVAAAREAGDADFDVLISCAFNYEALSTEFDKLGRIPVLKARINADMHMSDDLKNTGKGNLFVIFGEPDIDILPVEDGRLRVKLNGVDVFKPQLGKVESSGPGEIACWFIDTDYDEESFFARHAYFLGANDPYKALKTTLKAEIDEEAWASLHSNISRPFDKPESGRIAVKVINHLGDEVMKVFRVQN